MEDPKSTPSEGQRKGIKNKPSIDLSEIIADAQANEEKAKEAICYTGLFLVKPANKWLEDAKNRPIPKMLFGPFWFEGDLCILYADTNLGKSILAVQIGNSVSKEQPIAGFELEAYGQEVLYFDFELSDKQFECRYSEGYQNHYTFNNNFFRVEINPDATIPEKHTFEQYLYNSIERAIVETGARVLIIDNITYLKNETERAKDALPLMKHLKALKSRYGLSILALAHTPKRDMTKPLTKNDLQGSKMLMNFCDSSFAIGESSKDSNLRYLKQIKVRNTEFIHGSDNICVCQIAKPGNFLRFEFLSYGSETEHLKVLTDKDKRDLTGKVFELKQQGKSLRDIGDLIGMSHSTVKRMLGTQDKL